MPLHVYIDQEATKTSTMTGVGYFTERLTRELSKLDGIQVHRYAIGGLGVSLNSKILLKTYRLLRYLGIDLTLGLSVRLHKDDVVLGANYLIPPNSTLCSIPVIHDLCFIDHPEWVQPRNAHILAKMLPMTLERSSAVIAISKFTADRVREVYGYKKPILVVDIPPSTNGVKAVRPKDQDLVPKKYFLFIGTIEPRKNISTLLDAFEKLDESMSQYKLVIGGKPGWDEPTLQRLRSAKNKNIIYLDYVSDEEKKWLYSNALATIVPSHYEGFGMMTLESLVEGTPVITSDITPQREMLGDAGQYFAPKDSKSLSSIMIKFTNKEYGTNVLRKQQKIMTNYSWDKTARSVDKFIREVKGS